jgi:hypothetical protein
MTQELLGRVHRELLDVLKSVNELEIHHDGDHFHELLRDVEAALTAQKIEQDFHLHDAGIKGDNEMKDYEDDEFERIEREMKWRQMLIDNPPVAIPLITQEEWEEILKNS